MKRTVIKIDEEACDGCGLCVRACHEGALGLVNGKAKLMRDDFCDGMGDCLPACPQNAITFVEREAVAYNETAVKAAQALRTNNEGHPAPSSCPSSLSQLFAPAHSGGCPGSAPQQLHAAPVAGGCPGSRAQSLSTPAAPCAPSDAASTHAHPSQLAQWPAEIKLVPIQAPYYVGAHVLIAADCTAYAYADFHRDFMAGRVTLIGCPKLDNVDYAEKLTAIFACNDIASVTVARMEVPCCGGLEHAARRAVEACGKDIPFTVATISVRGELL